MGPVRDRLRYAIARLLDRLPGQCSTSIWQWANQATPRALPWSPNQLGCQLDAAKNGHCRCGKVTAEVSDPVPAPLLRPAVPVLPAGVARYCSACLWPHPPGQHTPPGQLPDGDT